MRRRSSPTRIRRGAAPSIIAFRRCARFAIENALHWLRDYRFDGLRLDAVHAIVEPGGRRSCTSSAAVVGQLAAAPAARIHLVLENDDNARACSIRAPILREENTARNGTTTITTPGTSC